MEKTTKDNIVTTTDKDVAEIRYPALDVTVTQSPHSFRNSPGRRSLLEGRSPKVRTPRRARTPLSDRRNTPKQTAGAASRILNFDLDSSASQRNQTIVEERIECRHRPIAASAQSDNVLGITQLKQRIIARNTQVVDDSPQSEVINVNIKNVESVMSNLPVIDEKTKGGEDSDCSTQSNELFSPEVEKDVDNQALQVAREAEASDRTSKDDFTCIASSLEALITPYQENQPADDHETFDSQRSLFDNTQRQLSQTIRSDTRNVTRKTLESVVNVINASEDKLLTKEEEYDLKKRMFVQAGPSNCPGSFEGAINFASSGESQQISTKNDETVNVHDLTSHLDEVDKMGTPHGSAERDWVDYVTPKYRAPSVRLVMETMSTYNIPEQRTVAPFYSDSRHVTGAVDVGYNTLRILAKDHCEDFRGSFKSLREYQRMLSGASGAKDWRRLKLSCFGSASAFVRPVCKPPSVKEVKLWLLKRKHRRYAAQGGRDADVTCREVEDHDATMLGLSACLDGNEMADVTSPKLNKSRWDTSHAISGVSLNNTHGFKMTLENLQEARSLDIYQYITSLVVELHAQSRGDKLPDPQVDPVQAIFFALANDVPDATSGDGNVTTSLGDDEQENEHFLKGFIAVGGESILEGSGIPRTKYVFTVVDEQALFEKFLALFHHWNPDILMGYEIEQSSWGYLVERGYVLGLNMPVLLSRIKDADGKKRFAQSGTPEDKEQEELHSHLKITGRIVLDLWRILKHEIALQSYTFENLAYHVLHDRTPRYGARELSRWWSHKCAKYRHRTIDYYLYRVEGCFRLIDHYDLIGRTSELARLFGILFYEVLSRGSQFRVESMMLRLAKPYRFVPVSPSVQQRAHMKAPEFLPLILEPESKFYKDPVIVLDFQSLYPSIIIAYNYCFSTCLGRVEHLGTDDKFEFGAYELEVRRKLVAKLLKANLLTVSPCGVAFVKDAVRAGIMPRMLREILDTRLMVKKSMKRFKGNKTLQKVLHSRQLGLKLIANVTYGYTAANFSGRMPACELADSVVSKGRETLQRAIGLVERHPAWGARVVYGDTDSLFVLCAGKSKDEAFRIGEEIVDAVTAANPSPVKLKLEKVYQPCILQTKKRYVGYMFESKDQKVPEFEAKGIETVRRDGCPAASKMLEKCLKLLFDSRDVSQVREYVLKQFSKILSGRVSIQDLTFAKEYRGRDGYRPGACVPALELTRKWMSTDKRKEPRSGERVPYVIVNGPPGLPLIKLVKSPHDLLDDSSLRPNALYYITKAIIPSINRCFKLIGADLFNWFNEMPRKQVQYLHIGSPSKGPKSTISQYFATAACASCGVQTKDGVCAKCLGNPQSTIATLHKKIYQWERHYFSCRKICESCCGRSTELSCNSLDCPVLYRLKQTYHDVQQTDYVRSLLEKFPDSNYPDLF